MAVVANKPIVPRDWAESGQKQASGAANEREDTLKDKGPETASEGRKTQAEKTGAKRAGKTRK